MTNAVATPPAVQLDTQRGFEAVVEIVGLDGTTHSEYYEIDANWGEVAAGFSVPVFARAEAEFPSLWKAMYLLSVAQRDEQGNYTTEGTWEPPACPTKYRDNPNHWIRNDAERKKFWPAANDLARLAGIKKVPEQRTWVHSTLGVERMEDFEGTREQAIERLTRVAVPPEQQPIPPVPNAPTAEQITAVKQEAMDLYKRFKPDIDRDTLVGWFLKDVGSTAEDALKQGRSHFEIVEHVRAAIKDRQHEVTHPPAEPPAPDPDPDPTPETDDDSAEPPPAEAVSNEDHYSVNIAMPALKGFATLTGVPIENIEKRLDAKYPVAAYKVIEMKGKRAGTDLGWDYVRDRFTEVFGIQGIGWRFTIHPTGGVSSTQRTYTKPGYKDKPAKEVVEFHISLIAHVFEYRIVNNGVMEWVQLSPMSDSHIDEDEGYAYRGAETSLLKHVLRSMGGFNHLYRNERLHAWATKQLAKQKSHYNNN